MSVFRRNLSRQIGPFRAHSEVMPKMYPQVRLNSLHVSSVSMIILRKTIHMLLSHTANQIQFQCRLRTLLQHPKVSSSNPTPGCSQDYVPGETLDESEESSESQFEDVNCWYLVSSASLWKLMGRCLQCGDVVHQITKTHTGSLLIVSLVCDTGHTTVWNSQPKLNQHPKGNVVLCAAVLFAGATYSRFHQICQFIGLQVPSQRTFFRIQENFLYPAVHRAWLTEKDRQNSGRAAD